MRVPVHVRWRRHWNLPVERGQIYWVEFDPVKGSEQGGLRPALVVQNDVGTRHSPTSVVAAITGTCPLDPIHLWQSLNLKTVVFQSGVLSIVLSWPPSSRLALLRGCVHHGGSQRYNPLGNLAQRR